MSAVDLLKNWKENNPQVKNIVLFVSDALRWDYTPSAISSLGVTFKCVASGTYTATSFPSIVTGIYPQHHGVFSFWDRLPNYVSSILHMRDYNTSLMTENTWVGYNPPESAPIYSILSHRKRVPLEELKPPFVYLEDEKGGHCPYGWSSENTEYEEWDCQTFFRDYGKKEKKILREKYREGIERSVRVFKRRMKLIEERGLTDETLMIFLSDHGELLGEYGGIVGHEILTAPEIVYVPTIFIHPDLPKGKFFDKEGIIRHVDLYPTISDLIKNKLTNKIDGKNLFKSKKLPNYGYTYYYKKKEKKNSNKYLLSYEIKEKSIWDKDGGYLFREEPSLIMRLFRSCYLTVLSNSSINAIYQRELMKKLNFFNMMRNYYKLLKYLCKSTIKYCSPSFSLEEAHKLKVHFDYENVVY